MEHVQEKQVNQKVNYNAQSHKKPDTLQHKLTEGWVFNLKERKSGAHSGVPSKNFWHSCKSAKRRVWERARKWVNACRKPVIFHCFQEEATLFFPLPLCHHSQYGHFQKNEPGECKHGGDGWHFPKLCLAISCGSNTSSPLEISQTFFLW